jgi:hypothetical protein
MRPRHKGCFNTGNVQTTAVKGSSARADHATFTEAINRADDIRVP